MKRLIQQQAVTILCGIAISVVGVRAAQAEDWPTYLRGAERQGFTPESLDGTPWPTWSHTSPTTLERAWGEGPGERIIEGKDLEHRVTFDDALHVAVAGNRVYFGSSVDHQMRCVDAETGSEIWHYFTGGPIRLAPTLSGGRVYFGSDDGYAYCLNADDGSVVWKLRAGPSEEWLIARGEMISRWPVRTGILVDDGTAYFCAGIFPHENVYVYAVDAASGEIVWKRDNISQSDAGRNDLSPQGYLLVNDDTLFVPSGRSLPAALSRRDGTVIHKRTHGWRNTAGGVVGGTRAMLADGQLYSWGAHHILAIDQKDGDVGFGWFSGQQMAVSGDAAYIATGTHIAKLDRQQYAVNSRKRHKLESDLYSLNRELRSAKGDKLEQVKEKIAAAQQQIREIEDVGFVWKVEQPHRSSLIVAGNTVIAGGSDGIVGLNAESGDVRWSLKSDAEVRGLAVANGRLFASTTTGAITCYRSAVEQIARTDSPQSDPFAESPWPADELTQLYEQAADQILNQTDTRDGFCFVVGSERGRLAWEIAKRSNLKVYGIEPDPKKVAESREVLSKAGVYGSRVIIHHFELSPVPYSNYFANLIVSDTQLLTGRIPADANDIVNQLKPLGGTVALGHPSSDKVNKEPITQWLTAMNADDAGTIATTDNWVQLTRGALPGAGSWSHQYGEPGNSACSDDRLVKGGLGVLWYGDPGESKMVNRHEGAVGPLAVNGRLFIQGQSTIMAYDAYNGRFLWEIENPKSIRTGVFRNENPGNLVASDDYLFFMLREKCVQLDAATGEVVAEHLLPEGPRRETHEWGYVAFQEGLLFGTATQREEIDEKRRRRGRATVDATDGIFAIDVESGKHLWHYQGKSIAHHTIAIGPQRVYFIDSSITSDERARILREDKSELAGLRGKDRELAEKELKEHDVRMTVAVDARSGKKLWAKPVDVTDCSEIGIGGGKLTLMFHNDVLVLCGANANGHYWKQFIAGEFSKRRLVALAASDGHELWTKDGNYRHRPIIVEDQLFAEPWAFDLYTGVQKTRENPLTGELEPWSMMRSGHHCGMLSASPNMLFFRAGYTGFYDLSTDDGTQHFAGHRTGCWINMIPANGLLSIPESSAGCVCLFSISSTIVMEPRESRRPWAIYSSTGQTKPVRHLSLNLGAPGDRRDARGRVWLSFPRPRPSRETSLDLALGVDAELASGGGYFAADSHATNVEATETPWVSSSYVRGLKRLTIPLQDADSRPVKYSVRLHFTELDREAEPGARRFDVRMQNETVLEDVDVVALAEGSRRNLVRDVADVAVTDQLVIELVPRKADAGMDELPILNGVEIERVDPKK